MVCDLFIDGAAVLQSSQGKSCQGKGSFEKRHGSNVRFLGFLALGSFGFWVSFGFLVSHVFSWILARLLSGSIVFVLHVTLEVFTFSSLLFKLLRFRRFFVGVVKLLG